MTDQVPAQLSCPRCAGPLVDGRLAIPIVGSLRFTYRLGTNEVSTEVAARMCTDCGYVELQARNPDLIGRARAAGALARPVRRTLRTPPSRHGQEQEQ